MSLARIRRKLAAVGLLCIGAALAAIVVFSFQSEGTIQFSLGLLLGLAITLAVIYLVRQWTGYTNDDRLGDNQSLNQALVQFAFERLGIFRTQEAARHAVNAGLSGLLLFVASSTMIAIFSVVFSVALYMATVLQVRKLEEQNRLINIQNHLSEASRRSSLIFLFGNILDRVADELKDVDNSERNLSTELVGRIAALGQAFSPYRFTENGVLVDAPISPERGQLVVALYNSQLSNATYFSIFNATNLTSADLRNATLHKINLSEATMDLADFRGSNLIESNLLLAKFRGAQFDDARLNLADVGLADFGNASLRGSDLRGVESFVGSKWHGAELSQAKLTDDDWSKLLAEAAEDGSREYLAENFELSAEVASDVTGPYQLLVRKERVVGE